MKLTYYYIFIQRRIKMFIKFLHLFSPVSACGMLCELTLRNSDYVWIRYNIARLIMTTSSSSLPGEWRVMSAQCSPVPELWISHLISHTCHATQSN